MKKTWKPCFFRWCICLENVLVFPRAVTRKKGAVFFAVINICSKHFCFVFQTLMAPYSKKLIIILHLIFFPLLGSSSNRKESDTLCLRSIKESLQDPSDNLLSWDFSDNSSRDFICQFSGVQCHYSGRRTDVMEIRLPNMGLKGMFPNGLEHCRNLEVLDLSNNDLAGPIPSNIDERLPFVRRLVLSNNRFSGEIPPSISGCMFLNDLRLDNNQLTGQMPKHPAKLVQIKTSSVANNQLSGQVPKFTSTNVSLEANENNRGLCSSPSEPCKEQASILNHSFRLGFITGFFVLTLSTITVFISYCVPRAHVKEAKDVILATTLLNQRNTKKKAKEDSSELPTMQLLQIPMLERVIPRMSFSQLSKATYDFNTGNIIGFGQMGTMYKAILPNGRLLAVKRLNDSQLTTEEFVFELKTLGSFRHVNCVPLLGFCIEPTERLLVYKYMSNGNLYNWLHPVQNDATILEWPLRIKIAVGIARGLAWLHHICSVRVAHLQLSSKCILLDQNFEPKLSNFGKAMLMNPNDIGLNMPRGFSINTEFWEWDFVKKDVFDFGIVLLELITGEDPSKQTKCKERISIENILADQELDSDILDLLEMASNCVQPFPEKRPKMVEVYGTLRVVGEKYGVVDVSEIDSR
ncbi:hypothetical protein DITRI_Ditri15bG0011000 [Diplodiscus trichospermus]